MLLDDLSYFDEWLRALAPARPADLWEEFKTRNHHPPLKFSAEASAVYSSNIEGNSIDLNFFLNSKLDPPSRKFKVKERQEIEDLAAAYEFARERALNEKNMLAAHAMLSKTLLPKAHRGRYRNQLMFVYSIAGIEYAAVEPDLVPEKMAELFEYLKQVKKKAPSVEQVFYQAALLHLIFVHIHPFQDGNGRMARLAEKWFLASCLGNKAWHIPAEQFYQQHRADYYSNIKIGLNYYTLDYSRSVPFLAMLVKALKGALSDQYRDR